MDKIILTILIFLFTSTCHATQLIYGTTYAPNGQVTSTNLNGNFNNVSQVVNGSLDNTNADTTDGYFFYKTVAALPTAGTQGATYFLTTDNTLNFDTGASFNKAISLNSPTTGGIAYYNSGWNNLTLGTTGTPIVSNGTIPAYGQISAASTVNTSALTGPYFGTLIIGQSSGTNIQATTDGIVYAWCVNSSGACTITAVSDMSTTPTTTVAGNLGIATGNIGSISFPVKKNYYYKVTITSATSSSINFMPMGS